MMSPDNSVAEVAGKDESQGSGGRRNGSTSSRKQEQPLKCPRCDSSNTKFCYYNNYNLSQPRHFCKTCRRYWTKGGALRNVPIGGGCRKNKKLKSRLSGDSKEYSGGPKLNFLEGFSPAMDFQLGGLNYLGRNINQPQNNTGLVNQFSSGEIAANPCFNLEFSAGMGFNFPSGVNQEMGSSSPFNLATSMETLSSMNQNMHWKLQQERLGFLEANQIEKPHQPILFHNLEISKPEATGTSNYAQGTTTPPPSNSISNTNESNASNWNNAMAWSNLNQYSIL